jgi:hypothetical protein
MRTRLVLVTLAFAATVTSAGAAPGTAVVMISGHVTDAFGVPAAKVCVTAQEPGAPLDETRYFHMFTDANGAYTLRVPPGTYDVTAQTSAWPSVNPTCPPSTFQPYSRLSPQTKRVDTLATTDAVDFRLLYQVSVVIWGDHDGPFTTRPGGSLLIWVFMDPSLKDRITMSWHNDASGDVVPLPQKDRFYLSNLWFEGSYVVPATQLPGPMPSSFHASNVDGIDVADDEGDVPITIDSTPPVIVSTYPAEGQVVDPTIGPTVRLRDETALGYPPGTATIRDAVTDELVRSDQGADAVRYNVMHYGQETTYTPPEGDHYTLAPGKTYTATFDMFDGAGNETSQTVTFSAAELVYLSDPFPTGTISEPKPVLSFLAEHIDPYSLHIRLQGPLYTLSGLPKYDAETHRATWDPLHPLVDGHYTASVTAYSVNGLPKTLVWEFDVATVPNPV